MLVAKDQDPEAFVCTIWDQHYLLAQGFQKLEEFHDGLSRFPGLEMPARRGGDLGADWGTGRGYVRLA